MSHQSNGIARTGDDRNRCVGGRTGHAELGSRHDSHALVDDFLSRDGLYQIARRTIDTSDGNRSLLTFVPQYILPSLSLIELADRAAPGDHDDELGNARAEASACRTPLRDLTCAQVRVLASRRLGMKWLAAPIASFVTRYPTAQCGLFDGDLALNAIVAWRTLARFALRETKQMLKSDFTPILSGSIGRDPSSIVRKAHIELATARALLANGGINQLQQH